MDAELTNAVRAHLEAAEAKRRASEFQAWCDSLDRISPRFKPKLKGRFTADTELQPHRWLNAGMDILRSAHVTSRVQLMDGRPGEPLQSFLPYSVFQAGAELFLKGMWLCRFPACRRVAQDSYVNGQVRQRFDKRLRGQGHDLLKLVSRLKRVSRYRSDPVTLRFLHRVSAIIRQYYYPLYQADRLGSWAGARYPKRFYDDQARVARANAWLSFPEQRLVIGLFDPMERHLDNLWQVRAGLMQAKKKSRRASGGQNP
jgi:hypothetical protein